MARQSTKFLTLQEVARRQAEHGGRSVHPTLDQLARSLGVDRNTSKKHIHDLEAEDRLAVKHSTTKGVANEYAVTAKGIEDLRRGNFAEASFEATPEAIASEGVISSKELSLSKVLFVEEKRTSNDSEATPFESPSAPPSGSAPGTPPDNRTTELWQSRISWAGKVYVCHRCGIAGTIGGHGLLRGHLNEEGAFVHWMRCRDRDWPLRKLIAEPYDGSGMPWLSDCVKQCAYCEHPVDLAAHPDESPLAGLINQGNFCHLSCEPIDIEAVAI